MEKKIGLVGWTQSKHKERAAELHLGEILYRTVQQALADSKVDLKDIDVVVSSSCDVLDGRSISNVFLVEAMGAFMKEESKVEEDGAFAVIYAAMRLAAGPNRVAMVVAHSKGSETPAEAYSHLMTDPFYLRPLGMNDVTASALQARSYFSRYGLTEKEAAKVAVKNLRNGLRNSAAHAALKVSVDDVMRSEVIATPIKALDAAPASDGCAVLILAEEQAARRLTPKPVWLDGFGYCHDLFYPGHRNLYELSSCRVAAKRAYEEAGIKDPLREIDLAEVHELFSFYELMLYEALGFCGEGEAGRLIDGGITDMEGRLPVNSSGGALCANPRMATGLVRIIEAAMQLRGEAGKHQLPGGPHRALAHATSGLCMQSNAVFILSASD